MKPVIHLLLDFIIAQHAVISPTVRTGRCSLNQGSFPLPLAFGVEWLAEAFGLQEVSGILQMKQVDKI